MRSVKYIDASLDQVRKVMNGTAEERTEVKSLPPDKRKEVLTGLTPNVLAYNVISWHLLSTQPSNSF